MSQGFVRTATMTAALIISTAGTLIFASPASAIPACKANYQCNYTFYSDSAKTNVVGTMWQYCDGTSGSTGQISGYLDFSTAACQD